ncbi:MAG: hypothetical protein CMQ57_00110 [Gammaproteobacteria bacterium]|jgi:phage repressor protein C with HTH and peptisase S24 domain|nr:hypothetical protein [Gammaproteobacteria bacterium]|tara:strand:+ start:662 stop:931 length:270 start_codon:yes stop_codon:yes gene_type:complete
MLNLFQVSGVSMMPSYKPRQYVLSFASRNIKKDDVIVFKDSKNEKFIKRVSWVNNEKFKVQSDNKNYPSVILGKVLETKDIIGKVIFKF